MTSGEKIITEFTMKNYGWNTDIINDAVLDDAHVFYLRDFRTNYVRVFAIPRSPFNKTSMGSAYLVGRYASELASLLNDIAGGEISDASEQAAQLSRAMQYYIKNTQTYSYWRKSSQSETSMHCIIHLYGIPSAGADAANVRPAIISTEGLILASNEFMRISEQLRTMDLERHPEWFR